MKINYITKQELNKIVDTHFTHNWNNIDLEVFGYNYVALLYKKDNCNEILSDFVADETEETYKNNYELFNKIKNCYLIGGYYDTYKDIMYCTDNNFKPISNRNWFTIDFMNYLIERS